jgi:uncharacterized protein (DUF488 family)
MQSQVLTVGHSNHEIASFIEMLSSQGVTAVADVRSSPFSRYAPQFNRKPLTVDLNRRGISYAFLGGELGGRPDDPACYVDGQVRYSLLARTDQFRRGIDRLVDGSGRERIAVLCSEREPLDCHRTLVVARELEGRGVRVEHLLGNCQTESHTDAMARLMARFGLLQIDFFQSYDELEEQAVERQERLVGFVMHEAPSRLEGLST